MSQYNYKAGLRNVGSYQASGLPYVSGNINASITDGTYITFPAVTRWIVVSVPTETRIAFSANGLLGTNHFTLPDNGVSPRLEVRVTELHLSGSNKVHVMAGLTAIEPAAIDNDTLSPDGRNWSGSVGTTVG